MEKVLRINVGAENGPVATIEELGAYAKANLNDTGAKSTTLYVSDDDLKVIHDDIIVED